MVVCEYYSSLEGWNNQADGMRDDGADIAVSRTPKASLPPRELSFGLLTCRYRLRGNYRGITPCGVPEIGLESQSSCPV